MSHAAPEAEHLALLARMTLQLQRAADSVFIDLEWMDRCPALTPLRPLPAFAEARRKVGARVETIWSA